VAQTLASLPKTSLNGRGTKGGTAVRPVGSASAPKSSSRPVTPTVLKSYRRLPPLPPPMPPPAKATTPTTATSSTLAPSDGDGKSSGDRPPSPEAEWRTRVLSALPRPSSAVAVCTPAPELEARPASAAERRPAWTGGSTRAAEGSEATAGQPSALPGPWGERGTHAASPGQITASPPEAEEASHQGAEAANTSQQTPLPECLESSASGGEAVAAVVASSSSSSSSSEDQEEWSDDSELEVERKETWLRNGGRESVINPHQVHLATQQWQESRGSVVHQVETQEAWTPART